MPNKIILLRHAQSVKNLKHIHGGQGEDLTALGTTQAKAIAALLRSISLEKNLRIFASTSFHTRDTAQIIAGELGIEVEKPFSFKPLYLGIADGISEQRLEEISPQTSILFYRWRNREIDIKQLKVEGMEPYIDFWNRAQKLLSEFPQDSNNLLVCSNSLMIVLAHCMAGNHPDLTDDYKHINIQNCGLIAFDRYDGKYQLDPQLTTVLLK